MEHAHSVIELPSPEWFSVALNPNTLKDLFEFKTTGVKVMSPCLTGSRDVVLTPLPVGRVRYYTGILNTNFNFSNLDDNPLYLDGD